MRLQAKEPELLEGFENALGIAAERQQPVVVVPFGQGYDADGNW